MFGLKAYRYLWYLQGIFAIIILLTGFAVDYIFLTAFFFSGNREYTFYHYILPMLPATLMLIIIAYGSFKQWRISLFLNIINIYYTVTAIVLILKYNTGNITIKYVDTLSTISLCSSILMNLAGIFLFTYFIRRFFRK